MLMIEKLRIDETREYSATFEDVSRDSEGIKETAHTHPSPNILPSQLNTPERRALVELRGLTQFTRP